MCITLRPDVETLQINALSIPFDVLETATIIYFFNGRKMAVKAISEVHRHGNDPQICSLHFSTDCARQMPLRLSIYDKKSFKLAKNKRNKKNNNMERVETSQSFCMNAIVK